MKCILRTILKILKHFNDDKTDLDTLHHGQVKPQI